MQVSSQLHFIDTLLIETTHTKETLPNHCSGHLLAEVRRETPFRTISTNTAPLQDPLRNTPFVEIQNYRTHWRKCPHSGLFVWKSNHCRTFISVCVKIQPFQDHHFRTPLNMAWQIFQQLTTAKNINKSLALAKCHISGTKLYIKTSPLQGRWTKRESIREPRGQSHSRSPSSDSNSRQACPVNVNSCRNRCPTPTHTGTTETKISNKHEAWVRQWDRWITHNKAFTHWIKWDTPTSWHNHLWFKWWTISVRYRFHHQLHNQIWWWTFSHGLPVHPYAHSQSSPQHRRWSHYPTTPNILKDIPYTPLPRPSKVINNTKSPKPATVNCKKSVQRKLPPHTPPQPT